jgi:hypothetical protein
MKTYGGVEVSFHVFLTAVLDTSELSELSSSRPGRFTPQKEPQVPTGWLGPRAGLDAVATKKKSPIISRAGTRTPVVQPVA